MAKLGFVALVCSQKPQFKQLYISVNTFKAAKELGKRLNSTLSITGKKILKRVKRTVPHCHVTLSPAWTIPCVDAFLWGGKRKCAPHVSAESNASLFPRVPASTLPQMLPCQK